MCYYSYYAFVQVFFSPITVWAPWGQWSFPIRTHSWVPGSQQLQGPSYAVCPWVHTGRNQWVGKSALTFHIRNLWVSHQLTTFEINIERKLTTFNSSPVWPALSLFCSASYTIIQFPEIFETQISLYLTINIKGKLNPCFLCLFMLSCETLSNALLIKSRVPIPGQGPTGKSLTPRKLNPGSQRKM